MDPYNRAGSGSSGEFGQQLGGLGRSFLTYLRTREPEHWLFFAAGIILGLIIS
jgi:hypothetical protein